MSFKQRNILVTLVTFSLILVFFVVNLYRLVQNDNFTEVSVFWLWGIVIAFVLVGFIAGMILTHGINAAWIAIRTGDPNVKIDDTEDERDELIDLKGTRAMYTTLSLGVFVSMLSYVFGQPALVMFTLLIFFGVFAQVVGDAMRLWMYRRGV